MNSLTFSTSNGTWQKIIRIDACFLEFSTYTDRYHLHQAIDFLNIVFTYHNFCNEPKYKETNQVVIIFQLANTLNYNRFILKIYVLTWCFFFPVWYTLSTIQIWNCTYYSTKGKCEEESIHFRQQSWVRERISSLVFFIFRQGGEPGSKDDKKKPKQFTKSQSAKGCIF